MADKEATLLIKIKQAGGEVLDRIVVTLGDLKEIAKTVYEHTIGLIEDAVKEYRQQELAINQLNQALVQQGIYTKELSEKYQGYAESLAKTSKYKDEEIVQAEAAMQGYLGQMKVTKALMQATIDLAAAKRIDLVSAAEMVGKTIGTTTNALHRQGITMGDNLNKVEKLDVVTRKLNSAFGGQAQAAIEGLGGMELFHKKVDDIYKAIGEKFAPTLEAIIPMLLELADVFKSNLGPPIDVLVSGFHLLAKAAISVFSEVTQMGNSIGAIFGTLSAVLALPVTEMKRAWQIIKDANKQAEDEAVALKAETANKLKDIDNAEITHQRKSITSVTDMVRDAAAQRLVISQDTTQLEQEAFQVKSEEQIAALAVREQIKQQLMDQQRIINENRYSKSEESMTKVSNAENQKRLLMEKAIQAEKVRLDLETSKGKMAMAQAEGQYLTELSNNLVTLTKGNNQTLIVAQKALGIGMVIINSEIAKVRALAELGPIWGAIAAGVITANEVVASAIIAGVTLADGGIVKARPGGIQATIGEGGKDEAVIPLDSPEAMQRLGGNGGGGVTIIVNGGLLGDRTSAREFAIAVDRELFELRRSGQAYSFDTGLV